MTHLREFYAELDIAPADRVTLILDASESAAACQEEVVTLAQDVLAGLPAGVERALYFLGNCAPYPAAQLAAQAGRWFAENRRRTSLATPVWEALPAGSGPIVVVGAGPLYDLADWAGTPLLGRTLLVALGESLQGSATLAEELAQPTAGDLLRRLYDPVVQVKISGPGLMPLWWDQAGYRLAAGEQGIALVAGRLNDYHLCLVGLVPEGVAPAAEMTHASGARSSRSLAPAARRASPAPAAGELGPEEAGIARLAARREPFSCLHCGQEHPWDTLRCMAGASLLGESVYPALRGASGFVLFHIAGERVSFRVHAGPVLVLEPGAVAIREGQQALCYRYEEQQGKWRRTGEGLAPYFRLAGGDYVVLL